MRETDDYFKSTYEESRNVFREHLDKIKKKWPRAGLSNEPIGKEKDNTIDMIYSEARASNDQVVFLSSGLHGIEGYAGAAMLHLFVDEYLDQIDPETTGICLIHVLNPWGMRNARRVTENNIDLNRNFFYDTVPEDMNEKFAKESDLFLPNGKIKDVKKEKKDLYAQLTKGMVKEGYSGVKRAKSMGQFEFEKGVYYGGKAEEPSTTFLKKVQKYLLSTYKKIIHMDWHTALGPMNELTIVNSTFDSRSEEELKSFYNLKNIQKSSPKDVKGDATNYFNQLKEEEFPDRYLFSALFEFGTFGTSKKAELRELTTIVLENQLYWEGAEKEEDREWVLEETHNMFYPPKQEWRESVIKEGRSGIENVLGREGILKREAKV
ncbi:M14 family metallopeptidase [Pseudalkalibacillus salsuginis]|uniref:M14 family metallopeptidase n=1 Tax=Pseudalkalibacillus salsuginis TaxID=2910972 RepID=UPI001F474827|nr:M14 family metallopeptidase [Pseudalkalibacillus salsuginis]MCF6410043.1 M14 family metallopeptidase [Pseudalkalibacillus salsuginis]